jgi:hypothetical protein
LRPHFDIYIYSYGSQELKCLESPKHHRFSNETQRFFEVFEITRMWGYLDSDFIIIIIIIIIPNTLLPWQLQH